jgi:formate hydrogenlyase transcriptional activator
MRDPSIARPQDDDHDALCAIVGGVEAETGEQFFNALVRHLAEALQAQYAFVSEFTEDGRHFRTRALWGQRRLLDNRTFAIAGTPCAAVLDGGMAHHADRLQERFPDDLGLVEWGVVSYAGVPLVDSSGQVVGHLAILDDRPMPDGARAHAIMRIFAARARAEIERTRTEEALRESEERLSRVLDSAMDAIVTFDAAQRIELFNHAAEEVFGCRAAEAIGASLDRFLTPALQRALDGSLRTFARGGRTQPYVWAPEGLTARRADGSEFHVEATISHVDVRGRTLYTLILRDVDERRRVEEEIRRLTLQTAYLQEEIKAVHNFEEIVGQSRALSEALVHVGLVATTDSSVLILGETGVGKELVARAIHSNSQRADRPLIKVNCAALPSGLVESELFGHEKGAFTGATERRLGRFELAAGGTIFLDEIGELPADVQVKLLRVLQEREFERIGGSQTIKVDVRVIAATNRDLERAVAQGTFRQDLYYRLNVFPVRVPPLRERPEDIPLLVHYFVGRYAAKIGRPITSVPAVALARLAAYGWPGNVRELENVVERAVILSRGPELDIGAVVLPAGEAVARATAAPPRAAAAAPPVAGDGGATLEEVERNHILDVLKRAGWRIDGPHGAARVLDMNPSTLRSRLRKLGIRRSADEQS